MRHPTCLTTRPTWHMKRPSRAGDCPSDRPFAHSGGNMKPTKKTKTGKGKLKGKPLRKVKTLRASIDLHK